MNIGIYIYDGSEVLDFSGPFEVFSTAARISKTPEIFNVFLVSETGNTVNARGDFSINPAYGFSSHPPIDVLIIVGGVYTREVQKPDVLNWIKEKSIDAQFVASVCTGIFLLAEAKVLSTQNVTTHWEDIPSLKASYPTLSVIKNQRWVDEGNIITSGGISSGIDMSLHLVSKISTKKLATNVAKQMEFKWAKNT